MPVKICLIRPPLVSKAKPVTGIYLPLGLAYLAAYLRKSGFDVNVVDAYGEAIGKVSVASEFTEVVQQGLDYQQIIDRIPVDADVIGISAMFSSDWPLVREMIGHIRQRFPERILIAGGEHVTALPEFCLRDAPALDFVVLGEGERTTARLLDALRTGEDTRAIPAVASLHNGRAAVTGQHHTTRTQRLQNLNELPKPAWDLFPLDNYFRHGNLSMVVTAKNKKTMPILASRGCPYACTFCTSINMWGRSWVVREPEDILDEIESYVRRYDANNFEFYDTAGIINKSWIIKFCRQLLARNLPITWHMPVGSRLEVIDWEVAKLMKQSGCGYVGFPLESGSERSLSLIKKNLNKQKAMQTLHGIVDAKLTTKVYFVIGFPDDTYQDVIASFWTAIKTALIGAQDATFFPFYPTPGSPLVSRLLQEGRIELDDRFFLDLLPYEKMSSIKSYSAHISDRSLRWLCFLGMAIFYAVNYLRRPWRAYSLCREIYTRDSQSRLGWYLVNWLNSRGNSMAKPRYKANSQ